MHEYPKEMTREDARVSRRNAYWAVSKALVDMEDLLKEMTATRGAGQLPHELRDLVGTLTDACFSNQPSGIVSSGRRSPPAHPGNKNATKRHSHRLHKLLARRLWRDVSLSEREARATSDENLAKHLEAPADVLLHMSPAARLAQLEHLFDELAENDELGELFAAWSPEKQTHIMQKFASGGRSDRILSVLFN